MTDDWPPEADVSHIIEPLIGHYRMHDAYPDQFPDVPDLMAGYKRVAAVVRSRALREAADWFENQATSDPGTAWFNNDAAKALRANADVIAAQA